MVGLITAGILLTEPAQPGNEESSPPWLAMVGGCWIVAYLPLFLVVHLTSMRPIGNARGSIVLGRVSKEFASAVVEAVRDGSGNRGRSGNRRG